MEKKENRGENNVKKNFFAHQLRRKQPSSRVRKRLHFEISTAVSFHGGELKQVA